MDIALGRTEDWIVSPEMAAAVVFCGLAVVGWTVRRARLLVAEVKLDRRVRKELEAYARLDARLSEHRDLRELCKQVCRTVAAASVFRRVAMLVSDEEGRLVATGTLGLDDLMVEALNGWGQRKGRVAPKLRREGAEDRQGRKGRGAGAKAERMDSVKAWTRSFMVRLELGEGKTELPAGHPWEAEFRMFPLWTTSGSMVGAIAVCDAPGGAPIGAEETEPLEELAAKLARTIENAALMERLLKAEKMSGLGQLAGGVAHTLNNPLTAVLGYAELIAETSQDPRVQEDANTIMREASRMKQTVQGLLDLWRPMPQTAESVSITVLVRELTALCEGKLAARGVRIVVEASEEEDAVVRGSRDRLKLLLEHLLHNAAQAIVGASAGGNLARENAIRVTVRQDERGVQVIVSDTGPGFAEPARVFDPFYTAQHPGQGAGLGLSVCYGIVREHSGEISAFNLHPQGAAVVVELPVRAVRETEVLVKEPQMERR